MRLEAKDGFVRAITGQFASRLQGSSPLITKVCLKMQTTPPSSRLPRTHYLCTDDTRHGGDSHD